MKKDEITLLEKISLRIRYELRQMHKEEMLICIPVQREELEKAYVSIQSINDVCAGRKVKIWIVHDDATLKFKKKMLNLADNVKISVVNSSDWKKKIEYYQKWIYMLPGCIACCSLNELFDTPLNDDEIVAAALYLKNSIYMKYIQNRSGIKPTSYVDTSVMLVNEPAMEWHRYKIHAEMERCGGGVKALELAVNKTCKEHIHILDQKWNCSWQPAFADSRNEFLLQDDQLRYNEAMKAPEIINYNGLYTPQSYPFRKESCYYWKTVRKMALYSECIEGLSIETGINKEILECRVEEIIQECEKK